MKNPYLLLAILSLTSGFTTFAYADDSQAAYVNAMAASQCTKISDDKKRLSCFDKAFAKADKNNGEHVPSPLEKSAVDEFGARHLKEQNEDKVDEIRLIVEKVELNARKRQIFYFTNGQVWENKKSTKLRIKAGDTAVVTEGSFSAYYLAKENFRGRVRVKRIK
ncbi:hypothetical protein [Brumicola blandensis]|uniref:Uncharacterized protein n=1 Tax=Brumicola blandensis TaxID=3075611 RepID=A0AAW8QZK7_9ALTE|nr:hypothetical protein [Alteromonas sp. W409]MDT0582377.1 hypothetical protein [Alteromonas sp. W409]